MVACVTGAQIREQFPEYVVGNIAYDQAVISIAVRQGVHIVEATDTIHAFHQTGPEGNSAGQYAFETQGPPISSYTRARANARTLIHGYPPLLHIAPLQA